MDVFWSIFSKNNKNFSLRQKKLYYPSNFPPEFPDSLEMGLIRWSNFYFLSYQIDLGTKMTSFVPPFQRYIQMWCISYIFLVIYKNVLNFRAAKVFSSQINPFKTMFQLMKVILIKMCHNIEYFLWFKVNCIPITAYSQQLSSHNQTILKNLICHQIVHTGELYIYIF